MLGDERAAAQMRTAQRRKQSRAQFIAGDGPRQAGGAVGVERFLRLGASDGALIYRAPPWATGAGRHVDDGLAVPSDSQPVTVGDLADRGGQYLPLAAHRQEGVHVLGRDDRAHPFLRLAAEHFGRGHVLRA